MCCPGDARGQQEIGAGGWDLRNDLRSSSVRPKEDRQDYGGPRAGSCRTGPGGRDGLKNSSGAKASTVWAGLTHSSRGNQPVGPTSDWGRGAGDTSYPPVGYYPQHLGGGFGQTVGPTFSQTVGPTFGQNFGQTVGPTFGQTFGQIFGQNFDQTVGQKFGSGTSSWLPATTSGRAMVPAPSLPSFGLPLPPGPGHRGPSAQHHDTQARGPGARGPARRY
jgi:hypothetical protein